MKNFFKKTLLSRKGLSWIFSLYLINSQFKLMKYKVINEIPVTFFDVLILSMFIIASLSFLGLIVFEKIKIGIKYGSK